MITASNKEELIAMTMMLYSMPRAQKRANALCVFCGRGESWRIAEAIRVWQERGSLAKHLFILEQFHQQLPFTHLSIEALREHPYDLTKTKGVDLQLEGGNTFEQSAYLVKKIQELGLESVAIFVSPYHLLRAFCTLVKAFKRTETPWISLIPVPVAISPNVIIPEIAMNAWDSVSSELERIERYQRKGDIATLEELADYLKWFWRQSPLI